jgi:hypothetical protein
MKSKTKEQHLRQKDNKSNKHDDNYSIHNIWNKRDGIMTDEINKHKWVINKVIL